MIEIATIKKTAKLAKLQFTDEKMEILAKELQNIVGMIDSLEEVDCEGIEPLSSVCDMYQRTRIDQVDCNDISGDLFANVQGPNAALGRELKCFIVPKVIE